MVAYTERAAYSPLWNSIAGRQSPDIKCLKTQAGLTRILPYTQLCETTLWGNGHSSLSTTIWTLSEVFENIREA